MGCGFDLRGYFVFSMSAIALRIGYTCCGTTAFPRALHRSCLINESILEETPSTTLPSPGSRCQMQVLYHVICSLPHPVLGTSPNCDHSKRSGSGIVLQPRLMSEFSFCDLLGCIDMLPSRDFSESETLSGNIFPSLLEGDFSGISCWCFCSVHLVQCPVLEVATMNTLCRLCQAPTATAGILNALQE